MSYTEESNEEFFKKTKNQRDPHDLGKVTIHNDQEMEMLIKYLTELEAGDELYHPAEILKFER